MDNLTVNTKMSPQEMNSLGESVNTFNKALSNGRVTGKSLNKDDFLKILVAQLTHQDPTDPMKDKEFIAQMAQFSSLEQMTNLSQGFSKLSTSINTGQAFNLLGRGVEIVQGEEVVSGMVTHVRGGEIPEVRVDGKYYKYDEVASVSVDVDGQNAARAQQAAQAYSNNIDYTKQ